MDYIEKKKEKKMVVEKQRSTLPEWKPMSIFINGWHMFNIGFYVLV